MPSDYRTSGVDIEAGAEAVRRILPHVRSTFGPETVSDIGGFGGVFDLGLSGYDDPLLVSTTDGVGTKAEVARLTGRFDTIGVDLVAMCVDDLVCTGATPLFFLDYLAVGSLDPATAEKIVGGIARGCRESGCTLIGGEMAEHPGVMDADQFDLAGFAVGAVERNEIVDGSRLSAGDLLIGLASPNLRSNGFSLVRHLIFDVGRRRLDEPAWVGASSTLADEILAPSVIFTPAVLAVLATNDVHAIAHITGGGLPDNLSRVLDCALDAIVEMNTWEVPRIFRELETMGGIDPDEMARVFNLGVGMVLVVPPADAEGVLSALASHNTPAWIIGELARGTGRVELRW